MEIEIFTLCDAAADYQGRLNILGVFDTIFAPNVPTVHPYCSIALRLRFTKIEQGKHTLAIQMVDTDGKLVLPPLNAEFEIKMPQNSRLAAINLALNLPGATFNRFGEHAVNLAVDNRELGSLPFWIRPINALNMES